jgi:hypothetical protein
MIKLRIVGIDWHGVLIFFYKMMNVYYYYTEHISPWLPFSSLLDTILYPLTKTVAYNKNYIRRNGTYVYNNITTVQYCFSICVG